VFISPCTCFKYTKAVKLIEKVRNYVGAVSEAVDLGIAVESVVKRVDALASNLSAQIQRNIQTMTCSSVSFDLRQTATLIY
jgi:hypothetical protein